LRLSKVVLTLMLALTTIYIIAVVYANANSSYSSYRYVVYAAYKYEGDTPPTEWYTPGELGITEVYEVNIRAVQIVVDRQKEPFPLQLECPIFLYKDEFYIVSSRWVTFWPRSAKWEIPTGVALGATWILTGAWFLKRRKRE